MGVYLQKDNTIATVTFDLPDSKVNLLTADVLMRLNGILDQIEASKEIKAVVIQSKKPNIFIAGADIKEIESIKSAQEGIQKAKFGQDILNKLEDLEIPTIAVIDGVALGGGCELALACTYRIGTFNEKVQIGLPEVNLGIFPGFGGTYRMPRAIGLSEGLKMVLSGKAIDSRKAHKIGLFDRLVPQAGLEDSVKEIVEEIIAKPSRVKYRPKKKKGLLGLLESNRLGHEVIFLQSRQGILKATKGFYPAPLSALEVIRKNYYLGRIKGLELEAREFASLAVTDVSKNLIRVFYLSEKFKKFNIEGGDTLKPQPIDKAAILGAGVMGGGIAQIFSTKDIGVRLKDINLTALASGLKAAYDVYREAVKKKRLTQAAANRKMGRITATLDYSGFQNADVVIEAVVENLDIKKKVFKELSGSVSPKTILATNTSALSVTEMAKQAKDPSKVVGFHFFNPVHLMPLVEVIAAKQTSSDTIVSALALARKLSKIPILVKDSPGFLVNRVLLHYINEAGHVLEESGDVEGIDGAMTSFGMPMGPFALSDAVGLDVGIKVLHILKDAFGDRYDSVQVFDNVIDAKLLGKKTLAGFYVYHGSKKKLLNPQIKEMVPNIHFSALDAKDCQRRLICMMINEAARCLEDRIIADAETVDCGMVFGTGFPAFRGGLLRYADTLGAKALVNQMNEFCNRLNTNRFRPCAYLTQLAEAGKGFYQ